VAALADKYISRTLQDLESLNVKPDPPEKRPRATKVMSEIIAMIEELIASGNAYEKNGSVYFNTTTAPDYGKLSKKNIDDLLAGARIEVSKEKLNPTDFILWKPAKEGEHDAPGQSWPSPWGKGRPGWHIECSAMVRKYLGEEIDIHGGGSDLIFPHHENEIAQSEAANNCNYARVWMHSGLITVGHKKMSKSQGNFKTLRQLAEKFSHDVIRFFLVSGHYRMPMEFTDEVLEAAEQGLKRVANCWHNLTHALETHALEAQSNDDTAANPDTNPSTMQNSAQHVAANTTFQHSVDNFVRDFEQAMDDDFNTADAVTAVYELVRFANKHLQEFSGADIRYVLEKMKLLCSTVLGVKMPPTILLRFNRSVTSGIYSSAQKMLHSEPDEKYETREKSKSREKSQISATSANDTESTTTISDDEINALISQRKAARADKNFAESDRIRDLLKAQGVILEDTPQGQRWHRA